MTVKTFEMRCSSQFHESFSDSQFKAILIFALCLSIYIYVYCIEHIFGGHYIVYTINSRCKFFIFYLMNPFLHYEEVIVTTTTNAEQTLMSAVDS